MLHYRMPSKLFLSDCPVHGTSKHRRRLDGGIRCTRCEIKAVDDLRRRRKDQLIHAAGGKCSICEYSKCRDALEFHHIVPAQKLFELSLAGMTKSHVLIQAEAAKCILVCANCHAEIHSSKGTLLER